MKSKYFVIAGGGAILVAVVWGWGFLTRVTPASLAARALSATELSDRANAALELVSMFNDPAAHPLFLRVFKESKDSPVKANALNGLMTLRDRNDLPIFYDAMDDTDKNVREAGLLALTKTLGVSAEQIGYKADDPPEKRKEAIRLLRDPPPTQVAEYIGRKDSAPPVAVATGPTPPASGAGPAPAPNPAATPSPQSAPPPAVPSSSVPTAAVSAPSGYPLPPLVIAESPGVIVAAWMWRFAGVLVLLFVLAGAVSLFIGGNQAPRSARDLAAARTNSPTVADEVDRILAARSYGLWPKAIALMAGAICAATMFTVAEFVQMAFRIEQRMDYTARYR